MMEVAIDPNHEGTLLVLFNGTSVRCYHDTDCAGAGICAINQKWAGESGGWCMCNTKWGMTGLNCDEWCDQAVAILVVNILMFIFSSAVAIVSFYLLFLMMRRISHRKFNPVSLTLLFTGFGSLFFAICSILITVNTILFPMTNVPMNVEMRIVKRVPRSLEFTVSAMVVLSFCVSQCAIVMLPLTWIDVRS
jgi:hypothetical protein